MGYFVCLSLNLSPLEMVLRTLHTLVMSHLMVLNLLIKLLLKGVVLYHFQLLLFQHQCSKFNLVYFVREILHNHAC